MSEQNPTYAELLSENRKLKMLLSKNNSLEELRLNSELEFTTINKLAIDGAKAGTLLLDITKDKLIWDKRSLDIYGIDQEDFGGDFEAWAKLVHEDDLKTLLPEVEKQLKSGSIIDFRYRIIRPDGEIRHLWANASIIRNEQGDAIGLSGLHFDETELVQAKKQLEGKNIELKNLNLRKDKFIRILAHDLKSPFNGMLGLLDIITNNYYEYSDEERLKIIDASHSSAQKAFNLLNDLLEWARLQNNKVEVKKEIINLREIINENISLFINNADEKEISIKNNIVKDFQIQIDKNSIKSVVRNLLINAIKFTSNGGSIDFDIKQTQDDIELRIKDTGVGMSKDIIDKLFKLDENITTPGTNNEKGTGLGLTICNDIVKLNSWKINIESQLGNGSAFKILIPK